MFCSIDYAARARQWQEITEVELIITHPPTIPVKQKKIMTSQVVFGNLDDPTTSVLTRDELLQELKKTSVKITFTNANGEVKEMVCTQCAQLMPESDRPVTNRYALLDVALTENLSAEKVKPVDENLIRVYSLDRQAWRSIRYERISQVQVN